MESEKVSVAQGETGGATELRWSDLTSKFKWSLLKIYGIYVLNDFSNALGTLVATFAVFFTVFGSNETGQAALLLGQLQLVKNVIGFFTLSIGGHLAE